MEILVKENHTIRGQYDWAKMLRYMYIINIFLAVTSLLTLDVLSIVIGFAQLYLFGIVFLRPLRIASLSEDIFRASWPRPEEKRYEDIRSIINISPYDSNAHFLIIVYKKGILIEKYNMAWIPVDQGIIEHLKARGVKIWNLWFWQEKD